jgi:hypothetical protein
MDDYIGLFIGPLFVLVLIVAVGAIVGALSFLLVNLATRNVGKGRQLARWTAFLFPPIAILYLATVDLGRDLVRYSRGQDSPFGTYHHYPLVNGYELKIFSDDGSEGSVTGWKVFEKAEAVQVAGSLILIHQGAAEPSHVPYSNGSFIYHGPDVNPTVELGREGEALADIFKRSLDETPPKQYVIVDTITSKVTHVNFEDLKAAATGQGVELHLLDTELALRSAVSAAAPGRGFLAMLFSPILLASIYLLYKLRQLVRAV